METQEQTSGSGAAPSEECSRKVLDDNQAALRFRRLMDTHAVKDDDSDVLGEVKGQSVGERSGKAEFRYFSSLKYYVTINTPNFPTSSVDITGTATH
ncbi:hypothetical protein AV530_013418 [Patagioenas fasciata monilis]|uniref:Uncharacterized protein n=1 Tax=Patagioenas fasciata monilis TaxID=372326 RepID=A0A1V4JPA7_PATFA|nr:hypothetical protein AV530_013418 [Patagioenas fasciata monilis]